MAQETLHRIGGVASQAHKGSKLFFLQRLAKGPIADKFFVAGSIFGLVGTVVVGITLWLMRDGAIGISLNYAVLREIHVKVQLFLLFGLFILGFLLQVSPRVLGCNPQTRGVIPLLAGILPFFALALGHGEFLKEISKYILAAPFLLTLGTLYLHRRSDAKMGPEWLFVTLSLAAFTVAAFMKNSYPPTGLLSFMAGIGSVLVGFSPAFIANLLGGKRLSTSDAVILFALLIFALSALYFGTVYDNASFFRTWAGAGALLLMFLVFRAKLYSVGGGLFESPLIFAFRLGFFWAISGFLLALVIGPVYTDYLLHILATGWALPILFVVSLQIMAFLSGEPHLPKRAVLIPLIIWQVVPILRCVAPLLGLGSQPAWVIVISAILMFGVWITLLVLYEKKILIRQFQLAPGETMVMEG